MSSKLKPMRHRVVVVTGASAGVGRAIARAFADQGATLALLARGEEGLEGAVKDVEQRGGRALAIPTDVSDPQQVEAAADRVEQALGPIDVWVNDAMVTVMSRIADLEPEDVRRVTEVTYLGTVHGTLAALKRMRPRNAGTIVQVGSALSYRAIPLQGPYCAAKFAVRGFTDSLRVELMHEDSDVHVTMVQLPAMNTPQFTWSRLRGFHRQPQPVPPIFQPEVAADAVVFASTARRREVFVGGNTVTLVWGNKLAPFLGDLYLARSGFDSQFTSKRVPEDRPDNLAHPLPGDRGAHGPFDDRARSHSLQQRLTRHRGALALGAAVGGGLLLAALARR